ncbi:MAG: hypothetical protein ACI3W5_09650 [Faecousia sp.]
MGECRGRCPHRPAENTTILLRNCGESATPQRADVGIGPYAQYFGAVVNYNLSRNPGNTTAVNRVR